MFTLEEFKQNVAQDLGYNTWNHFLKSGDPTYVILQQLQLANDRYRDYYAEQMCIKQREICAEEANFYIQTGEHKDYSKYKFFTDNMTVIKKIIINKQSILSAELASRYRYSNLNEQSKL